MAETIDYIHLAARGFGLSAVFRQGPQFASRDALPRYRWAGAHDHR